jgi:hypothetical protein
MNFSTNVQGQNNTNSTTKSFALLEGFGLDNVNNVNLNKNVNVTRNISTQGF